MIHCQPPASPHTYNATAAPSEALPFSVVCGRHMSTTVTIGPLARVSLDAASTFPIADGKRFSATVESTGGTPTPIIVEQSIGKLFLAGVIPGFLLAFLFAVWVVIAFLREKRRAQAGQGGDLARELLRDEYFSWRERLETLPRLFPYLVLILPGILKNGFDPTWTGIVMTINREWG